MSTTKDDPGLIVIAKAPHVVVELPLSYLVPIGLQGRHRLVLDPKGAREIARDLWDKAYLVEEQVFDAKRRP
jgi:hypothetical protein